MLYNEHGTFSVKLLSLSCYLIHKKNQLLIFLFKKLHKITVAYDTDTAN